MVNNKLFGKLNISVRINWILSQPLPVNTGVTHGSVLSPTLFLLFVNDLWSTTSSSIPSFVNIATLRYCPFYHTPHRVWTHIYQGSRIASVSSHPGLEHIFLFCTNGHVTSNAWRSPIFLSLKRLSLNRLICIPQNVSLLHLYIGSSLYLSTFIL